MTPILTAAEMRAAEQALFDADTSVDALMTQAAAGVAEAVWRFAGGSPTLVLCGPGNNGGDGYVIARLLMERGVQVSVAATAPPRTEVAARARAAWTGAVSDLADCSAQPVLVDALFGIGLTRGLDEAVADRLAMLVEASTHAIAVDLPSGIGTDDGVLLSPVPRFDLTVALGALKPAHVIARSAERCGRIATVDLGIDSRSARTNRIERPRLAAPGIDAHKYRRGLVVAIGGAMPGAIALSAAAALRGGAGYVVAVGANPAHGPQAIVHRSADALDATLNDRRIGAILIGPGLGRDAIARDRLDRALASDHPLVLDADALVLLAGRPGGAGALAHRPAPCVLTPHDGEFARLFPRLGGSAIDRARAAAAASGAIIVLKGPATVVAAPVGQAAIAALAPGWLASAGTGDVLAGLCAARLAGGTPPFQAAAEAVWLHGEAARLAGPALIADDLAAHIPAAIGSAL
ncbi:NAD(P)H-hydrate dehydratase [Sphingomonas sp. 1P06PA]|uniref:NAD(P)H-hydrate dehydratase n=1 Tax=Sphingomonas sp. 1P06PA TaxID=554121 RepID=UPI0039A6928A